MLNTHPLQHPLQQYREMATAGQVVDQASTEQAVAATEPTVPHRHPLHFSAPVVLNLGRGMMLLSLAGAGTALAVAYIYPEQFSLGEQVAAHLLLPMMAGFFKLGYVIRLAAHHALGNYQAG